jgi:GTP cyclohydrolase I
MAELTPIQSLVQEAEANTYDHQLGESVAKHLISKGIENPLTDDDNLDVQEAFSALTYGIGNALSYLGIDMDDPSLINTPDRYARMFITELTKGLHYEYFPKCTTTPITNYDQMVLVQDLTVISLCEHHLQTIYGVAHVAYIPSTKLLGLSKFARVVEFFSRRPQMQERLTEQIASTLSFILDTPDVAVVIKADHFCMKARGALQANSKTTTSKLTGRFLTNPALHKEFFDGFA